MRRENPISYVVEVLKPYSVAPEDEAAMRDAAVELGRQTRQFGRLIRQRLGVIEPEALIRAYPDLFADTSQTKQALGAAAPQPVLTAKERDGGNQSGNLSD
jgi:hypothetical protein